MTIATVAAHTAAIVLPHLYLHNANAISSHMTWGFPAMTAFTGFMHALERKLQPRLKVQFEAIAVVCHRHEHLIAPDPRRYAPRTFTLTRNPLDKFGEVAAITEEGRMHATVSLVLLVKGEDVPYAAGESAANFADAILQQALAMRIAGASLRQADNHARRPRTWVWNHENKDKVHRRLMYSLLPGFALISRVNLLQSHLAKMRTTDSDATTLDALLDLCAVHHQSKPVLDTDGQPDPQGAGKWLPSERRERGYLVPIPAGYAAISPLYPAGTVRNARDAATPFRFAEVVLSLGEWRSPHRAKQLEDILWRHDARPQDGIYLTTNPSHSI
jgi:CRISPR-associated protein Csy2